MPIGEVLKGFLNQSAHVANDYNRCFQPIAVLRMYATCERKYGDNWLYGQQDAVAVGSLLQLALVIRRLFENLNLKSYKGGTPIQLRRFSDEADQIYESVGSCGLYKLSSKIAHSRRMSVYGHSFAALLRWVDRITPLHGNHTPTMPPELSSVNRARMVDSFSFLWTFLMKATNFLRTYQH